VNSEDFASRSALPSWEYFGEAGLTEREAQVLRLLARGLTNREIASDLHLSHWTVKRHLSRISRRLGLSRRVELALWFANQAERR
jgi:DNA-binding NarL/FixJ family response regulator